FNGQFSLHKFHAAHVVSGSKIEWLPPPPYVCFRRQRTSGRISLPPRCAKSGCEQVQQKSITEVVRRASAISTIQRSTIKSKAVGASCGSRDHCFQGMPQRVLPISDRCPESC